MCLYNLANGTERIYATPFANKTEQRKKFYNSRLTKAFPISEKRLETSFFLSQELLGKAFFVYFYHVFSSSFILRLQRGESLESLSVFMILELLIKRFLHTLQQLFL